MNSYPETILETKLTCEIQLVNLSTHLEAATRGAL